MAARRPPQAEKLAQKKQEKKEQEQLCDPGVPFCDAHCHLDMVLEALKIPVESLAERIEAGTLFGPSFKYAINVCCFPRSLRAFEEMQQNPALAGSIYTTYGCHPHAASEYDDTLEQAIVQHVSTEASTVAWGECGLDFFKSFSPPEVQKEVFARQLRMLVQTQTRKPLVLHTRDADEATLRILSEGLPSDYPIHLHCYTGAAPYAITMLDRFPQLKIGFTGMITFKNASKTREAVAVVPMDRLLLETDGPFMAPLPFRGATAHPGHIPLVAAEVARVKGVTQREVIEAAGRNTAQLYHTLPCSPTETPTTH
eukprot:TRINITY_DN2197_c0_g1_i3.p1 TRINITY_DN2197_c0_g1~~TRINITY_DN2197_c0_g1_i3.p1  ORF type:complete len:321 (+),score=68.13 TRINITY_DN2197_c0_g1_i3:28-963(+)